MQVAGYTASTAKLFLVQKLNGQLVPGRQRLLD